MNLPDLVQLISDTYNHSEQLWTQVGLVQQDIEQRKNSFFQQLVNDCQEFHDQQQAYYDYINNQIDELKEQISQLSKQLNLSMDIPGSGKNDQKCRELQQLERVLKTLQEEAQKRTNQCQKACREIQVKCETCGIPLPVIEVQQILGAPIAQFESSQSIPSLEQITQLNRLNQEIDKQIGPAFEKANQLRAHIIASLEQLGRFGLEVYLATPDVSAKQCMDNEVSSSVEKGRLTTQQLNVLTLTLNNQLQPRFNTFLEEFDRNLTEELCERRDLISQNLSSLQQKQQVLYTVFGILNAGHGTLAPQLADMYARFQENNLSMYDTSILTDKNYQILLSAQEIINQILSDRAQFFVMLMIQEKYRLLSQILSGNEKFKQISQLNVDKILRSTEHQRFNKQYETPEAVLDKLVALLHEIEFISQMQSDMAVVQDLMLQYEQLQNSQQELLLIAADKSRYTSRSRDALQKRKREETIKKQLAQQWPKVMAMLRVEVQKIDGALSCRELNLNDCDVFWNGQIGDGFTVQTSDLLNRDYRGIIDAELARQDQRFQQRYKQFLAFYSKESNQTRSMLGSQTNHAPIIKTPAVRGARDCLTKSMLRSGVEGSGASVGRRK